MKRALLLSAVFAGLHLPATEAEGAIAPVLHRGKDALPRIQITLDGQAVALARDPNVPAEGEDDVVTYGGLRLAQRQSPLELTIDSLAGQRMPAVRIQTRMDGLEKEWRDHESMMWLVLRYLDENNQAVSSASFTRRGESPGWNGVPQQSRFHVRTDEAVVPDMARRMQLLLVSGGTPRTTGFWAVRRLRVARLEHVGASESEEGQTLFRLERLTGIHLESPQGNPEGWTRDGTSLRTAKLYQHAEGSEGVESMLALIDVDPTNTGGWLQLMREAVPVAPGQRLRIETEELYSIGRGGEISVEYRSLPVGNYVFQARVCDELGRPTGASLRIPVEVTPPFYATLWFRIFAVVLLVGAMLAAMRQWTRRNIARELERLERRRAVEEERTRLARDIHDEMGARLTQISLLAGRAQRTVHEGDEAYELVRQINGAAKELATALDEIVWAANPVHDTLDGLANYLSQYAGSVLSSAGIRCRLEIPPLLPSRPMSSGTRHRLMMAAKEALNNAIKHAEATEVHLALALEGDAFRLTVADNGKGFDAASVMRGNGLENLRRRLAEAGGSCEIDARPGSGTRVTLSLLLPAEEARP